MTARVRSPFGAQLRHWRQVRSCSQLDLSIRARTTARHVSFLETGRSRPSADIVGRLAEALEVPLRARNDLLVAAGLPPRVPERALDSPAMGPVLRVVERLLAQHAPFPAIVHDVHYKVVMANETASRAFGVGRGDDLVELLLGDGPFRRSVVDWPGWAWAVVDRLRREAAHHSGDPAFDALLQRALDRLTDIPRPADGPDGNDPVWSPVLAQGTERIRVLTTVARFHNARDVTADDLRVELIYPYDDASEAIMRRWSTGG